MAYTTIDNPELYFQTKLYTGDASATAFTLDGDENMAPALVWFKSRSRSDNHRIVDALRTTNSLKSNTNAGEVDSASDGFTSLDADDFTLNGSGGGGEFNASGGTYVAWCWKESAVAGMDIVLYTGNGTDDTDISHSLSAVPEVIFAKKRSGTSNWNTYHHKMSSDPKTDYLSLDRNDGVYDSAGYWSDEAPTSSVFTLGNGATNTSSQTFVTYLWRSVQGYSSFNSYTGNGSTSGPMIWLGFRPAFIIAKRTDADGYDWTMMDSKRSPFNEADDWLYPNMDAVEDTNGAVDFLSNGFKIRQTHSYWNTSGASYIYMAFAEAPFVNSNGVPCNAR